MDHPDLQQAVAANSVLLRRIHLLEQINFVPVTAEAFRAGVLLYRSSKSKRRFKGSEYRAIWLDGQLAFACESNHWGQFSSFSHLSSGQHDWRLPGVKTGGNNDRYYGAVLVEAVRPEVEALMASLG